MTGKKTTQNQGAKGTRAASKKVTKSVANTKAAAKAKEVATEKKEPVKKATGNTASKSPSKMAATTKKQASQHSSAADTASTVTQKEPVKQQSEMKKEQTTKSTSNATETKSVAKESKPEVVTVSEKRGNNGIAWFAALLGLGGLGLAGYTYMNTQISSSRSEGALTRLDDFSGQTSEIRQANDKLQTSVSELNGQITAFDTQLKSFGGKFGEVESSIASVKESMDANFAQVEQSVAAVKQGVDEKFENQVASLEADYGRIAGAMSQFQLKEVEAIVSIAQERLVLGQDVDSAIRALTVADTKLAEIGDTRLLSVRQQIQTTKAELEKVEPVNVTDLVTRLAGAEQSINSLPLAELGKLEPTAAAVSEEKSEEMAQTNDAQVAEEAGSASESGKWWQSLEGVTTVAKGALSSAGTTIASSLEDVVVVHDLSETATPLMVPEQRYFLKENLRMAVQNTGYALIRGYEEAAKASATSAKSMLSQYYVGDDAKVQELNALLNEVEEVQLDAEIPDISATVDAVRAAANQANQ